MRFSQVLILQPNVLVIFLDSSHRQMLLIWGKRQNNLIKIRFFPVAFYMGDYKLVFNRISLSYVRRRFFRNMRTYNKKFSIGCEWPRWKLVILLLMLNMTEIWFNDLVSLCDRRQNIIWINEKINAGKKFFD
jgi:hypothetical protein